MDFRVDLDLGLDLDLARALVPAVQLLRRVAWALVLVAKVLVQVAKVLVQVAKVLALPLALAQQ
jgi:hypothetical protein